MVSKWSDHKEEETKQQHESLFDDLRLTIRHGWQLIEQTKSLIKRIDEQWGATIRIEKPHSLSSSSKNGQEDQNQKEGT